MYYNHSSCSFILLFFICMGWVCAETIQSTISEQSSDGNYNFFRSQIKMQQSLENTLGDLSFKKVETLSFQKFPVGQKNNQQNSHYNIRFQVKLQSLNQKNFQNPNQNIEQNFHQNKYQSPNQNNYQNSHQKIQQNPHQKISQNTHNKLFSNIRLLSDCNIVGCSQCNQQVSSFCDKCQDTYVMDGRLCYQPGQYPDQCQSAQKVGDQVRFHCTRCYAGYTLDSNDLCQKCLAIYCSSCSIKSLDKCDSCLEGYYFNNYFCQRCRDNCQSCKSSNHCFKCVPGYILYSGSYCGTCAIDNCQSCYYSASIPICNQCFGDYLLFQIYNECYNLTDTDNGTVSYSGFTFKCSTGCLKCQFVGKFIGSNNVCRQCDQGYGFNSTLGYCSKCQNNCKYCGNSSLSQCTDCFPGYALTGSTCTKCFIENCAKCDLSNTTVCTKCADNYYLSSSGYCYLCNDGCKQCDESGNCTLCSYGYHFYGDQNGSMVCQSCISGCGECQYWAGKCTECLPRFYLTNNNEACSPCQQGCWKCDSSTDCTQCDAGKNIINGSCVDPIQNCKTLNESGKCVQCLIGYELNQTNNSCVYSYESSIVGSKRYSCSNDAYLYSSDCYLCSNKINNCLSCQNSYCLKCAAGYYISNTGLKCLECSIDNCKQCYNSQICSKCQDGYYLQTDITKSYQRMPASSQDLITSYGNCRVCSENCLTCQYRDNMCIKCKSGYLLTSSRNCITQNRFNFLMKIDANFSEFASRIDNFKAELIYLIRDDQNVSLCIRKKFIQFTGISSGSVDVAGYVSATSPSNLQKTYDSFNAYSSGGQLNLGFSIISSQLSNYQTASTVNDSSSTTNSTNNSTTNSPQPIIPKQDQPNLLPIIVGVAIGVIVLIAVIVVLVYCFCCNKQIEQMREISEDKKSSSTGQERQSNQKDEKQFNPDSQKYFNNPSGQNNQNWVSPQYYL